MSINFDRNRQRKIYETRRTCTNYKKLFRFTKENVDWLSLEFLGENFETRGGRLTNHQRMQAFLRYMSDPGYQVCRSDFTIDAMNSFFGKGDKIESHQFLFFY